MTGAAVRFDRELDFPFATGDRVTLVIRFDDGRSVQADAFVRTRTEMDAALQFGFEFAEPSAIRAKLPAHLLTAFNERAAFRVEPDSLVLVALEMPEQELRATGHMHDVSVDGLGVIVDGTEERLSTSSCPIRVTSPVGLRFGTGAR